MHSQSSHETLGALQEHSHSTPRALMTSQLLNSSLHAISEIPILYGTVIITVLGGDVECSRDLTDSSHSLISLISLTHLTHSTDSLVTEGNKFREIDKSAPQQNGIRVIDLVV